MKITGIENGIAIAEARGFSVVFKAYADSCPCEDIMEGGIGFNANSGYVYIALENGISIASMFGRDAEFITTDFETGEESFFDSYSEAEDSL